jgi:hypothetical protein
MNSTTSHFSFSKLYIPLLVFVALMVTFTMLTRSRETTVQHASEPPIKFSHRLHTEDAGVQCVECHDGVMKSGFATDLLLPKKPACQSCHEEQLNQGCTFCHTSDDVSTYTPLKTSERELLFSHAQHLQTQDVSCTTCHAGIELKEGGGKEHVPTMATCATCHNDVAASSTCETCHTDLAALRPFTHNRADFMREHKISARMSDASCSTCHTESSCADCHLSAGLTKVDPLGADMMSPRSPRLTAIDRGQSMALTKVHDLNFRFTHPVSAKGKIAECQTCHSVEQECAVCHAAGGNINQLTFKPAWHAEAGFVTIGVGSGGGRHAQMARRDMESCVSCHGLQGSDPTCAQCHTDADGIRGTDPKTHQRGFMASVNGPWHSDPGANCFVCHTDPNARVGGMQGQGFCSYCHK